MVSRVQKNVEAAIKANLDHKEEGKLLKAELAFARREARKEERRKRKKEEKAYEEREQRLFRLAGRWLFEEFGMGNAGLSGSAARLEGYFKNSLPGRVGEKDKEFVVEMLPIAIGKRAGKKSKSTSSPAVAKKPPAAP
jgi:hypothetical protein